MAKIEIETPRLMIREFVENDHDSVHLYASDPLVVRYLGWGPNRAEDTGRFLERVVKAQSSQPRFEYELAVVLKSENRLIGG